MTDSHIERVIAAITSAERAGRTWSPDRPLEGLSGSRLIGALQRLAATLPPTQCYLEIGVYRGLTLLSVAGANRSVTCFGIDNFAFFDTDGKNKSIVEERMNELGVSNATLLDLDYEDALESLNTRIGDRRIGVYFVDGPHDYRSQLMCLELARPWLSRDAVIVIDDSNYAHVRQANRDFLRAHPEFKLVFEAYTPAHPNNLDGDARHRAVDGWWNGVNVIVADPEDRLVPAYPPTERDRTLFENDHLVHGARGAELAPTLLSAIDHLRRLRLHRFLGGILRILTARVRKTPYSSLNTYSETLPKSRLSIEYRR
jgi:hypothetical protein